MLPSEVLCACRDVDVPLGPTPLDDEPIPWTAALALPLRVRVPGRVDDVEGAVLLDEGNAEAGGTVPRIMRGSKGNRACDTEEDREPGAVEIPGEEAKLSGIARGCICAGPDADRDVARGLPDPSK